MQIKVNRKIPGRSLAIIIFCMAAWTGLLIRLFYLQVISYEKYQNHVIDNVQRETTVSANRGIIYDCNMIQLATNTSTWRIFISPRDITDQTQANLIAKNLSEILEVDYNTILEKASKTHRADETIKKNIDEEAFKKILAFIEEYDLDDQIHYEEYTRRYYPYGKLASSVIGFVGTDGGLLGLELEYDNQLTGVAGKYITARDANGLKMPYKYDSIIEAENGANLVTTIDMKIQAVLENQLEATYYDSKPLNRVTGIVMDVNTGGILGMATYPNFDLNRPYVLNEELQSKLDASGLNPDSEEYNKLYWELVYYMWKNKAVSELYEPGSTFKVITTAAALEESAVTFNDTFHCSGSMKVEGYPYPIHCHRRVGHGTVTFARGLQQSCNPTLMQVAAKLGKEKFFNYFKAFGYTEKTGIDLPGEEKSIYTPYSGFNQVSLAVYSFGQTFKVTPIQQLSGICAVANGGYLVTPHLVSKIVDEEGNVIKNFDTTPKRQVVSSEICSKVSQVLEEGVSGDGGAKNAYVAGYKIAAKTGTSQKRDEKVAEGETENVVGSTVAYAPSDDPQVAVIIIVDSPQTPTRFGSVVAAPYVANVMNEILPTLGIERQYDDESQMNVAISDYTGLSVSEAKKTIEGKGIKCEVMGNGDTVVAQVPSSGSILLVQNGKVVLYTGTSTPEDNLVTIPDLTGVGAETANTTLVSKGLNVAINGSLNESGAVVTAQSPAAGEAVPKGSLVTITIRHLNGTE